MCRYILHPYSSPSPGVSLHVWSPARQPGPMAGDQPCREHGMSKRTLTPLAPCPVNLHPINLLSGWRRGAEGGAGSVCLLSAQVLPDVVLLGASEGPGFRAPGLRRSRSREPAASSARAAVLGSCCQRLSHRHHSSTSDSSSWGPRVLWVPPSPSSLQFLSC